MDIIYILLLVILLLIIVIVLFFIKASYRKDQNSLNDIGKSITLINTQIKEAEENLHREFVINRQELSQTSKDLRLEVGNRIDLFTSTFSDQLNNLIKSIEDKFSSFQQSIESNNKTSRSESKENLGGFRNELSQTLKDYKDRLKEQFLEFEKNQNAIGLSTTEKLNDIKFALERSVKSMQEGNESKLEEMRKTVDEKLQKTLETRLAHSFDLVSKNLESVHKGLGEMQQLAIGVGDLKKVLSNVKTRGILGEIQLSNILEQLLSPEQYDINVITKKGSSNRV